MAEASLFTCAAPSMTTTSNPNDPSSTHMAEEVVATIVRAFCSSCSAASSQIVKKSSLLHPVQNILHLADLNETRRLCESMHDQKPCFQAPFIHNALHAHLFLLHTRPIKHLLLHLPQVGLLRKCLMVQSGRRLC